MGRVANPILKDFQVGLKGCVVLMMVILTLVDYAS